MELKYSDDTNNISHDLAYDEVAYKYFNFCIPSTLKKKIGVF